MTRSEAHDPRPPNHKQAAISRDAQETSRTRPHRQYEANGTGARKRMTTEARQAFIFSYLRIQKAETEQDQAMFALDWFRTYGEEAYEEIKRMESKNELATEQKRTNV